MTTVEIEKGIMRITGIVRWKDNTENEKSLYWLADDRKGCSMCVDRCLEKAWGFEKVYTEIPHNAQRTSNNPFCHLSTFSKPHT